jgi:hypothetical protein
VGGFGLLMSVCCSFVIFLRVVAGDFCGDFEKGGDLVWCFCGVSVVDCVANVVLVHHIFERPLNVPNVLKFSCVFDALRGRA